MGSEDVLILERLDYVQLCHLVFGPGAATPAARSEKIALSLLAGLLCHTEVPRIQECGRAVKLYHHMLGAKLRLGATGRNQERAQFIDALG
jgi:hypothetical protein